MGNSIRNKKEVCIEEVSSLFVETWAGSSQEVLLRQSHIVKVIRMR